MTAAQKLDLVRVEDYLAGELTATVKHEYLGGFVHAMAGATNNHNVIAGNIFANLYARLRGNRCRPYNSDTKIRIRLPTQVRFYYPDVSVVCNSNSPNDSFQDAPVVIVKVLSLATRRTDMAEKLDAYKTIPTLSVYLLVEQDFPTVTVFRRTGDSFECEVVSGLDGVVALPEIEVELPLSEVYADVTFVPEANLRNEQESTTSD